MFVVEFVVGPLVELSWAGGVIVRDVVEDGVDGVAIGAIWPELFIVPGIGWFDGVLGVVVGVVVGVTSLCVVVAAGAIGIGVGVGIMLLDAAP